MDNVFDSITGEKMHEMVNILASLPPPEKQEILTDTRETCACGKKVHVADLEELDTGVFKTYNDVCKNCPEGKKLDKETARVVCAMCKRVICRIKPVKDKTGFTFYPNKTYHLASCALCAPGKIKYPIVEKVLWDRKNKK